MSEQPTTDSQGRPIVTFTPEQIAEMDKPFFREAFEMAAGMTQPQVSWLHRAADDLQSLVMQLRDACAGVQKNPRASELVLIKIAATAARNARIAVYRKTAPEKGRASVPPGSPYAGDEWAHHPGGKGGRIVN